MAAIILHHGFMGGGMSVGRLKWVSFRNIDTYLAEHGYQVFVSAVHPTASIQRRAGQLRKWILSLLPQINSGPIILVGHSMGGLDARYMLAEMDMAKHISALLTVCSPHRGSALVDWVLDHFGRRWRAIQWAEQVGLETGALRDLTTEQCARFNEKIRDVPGVRYASVAAARPFKEMPAFARIPHKIVYAAEGPNDGLVSVQSARWTNYLTTWKADHWQTVNRQYSWRKCHHPANIAEKYLDAIDITRRDLAPR